VAYAVSSHVQRGGGGLIGSVNLPLEVKKRRYEEGARALKELALVPRHAKPRHSPLLLRPLAETTLT